MCKEAKPLIQPPLSFSDVLYKVLLVLIVVPCSLYSPTLASSHRLLATLSSWLEATIFMMQFSFSLLTVALLTFSSVSPILGRIAVPELWRKERFDAEQDVVNKLAKRNYVCYEDDFLNGLEADPGYFSALCSSYLTETDAISTSDVTSTT